MESSNVDLSVLTTFSSSYSGRLLLALTLYKMKNSLEYAPESSILSVVCPNQSVYDIAKKYCGLSAVSVDRYIEVADLLIMKKEEYSCNFSQRSLEEKKAFYEQSGEANIMANSYYSFYDFRGPKWKAFAKEYVENNKGKYNPIVFDAPSVFYPCLVDHKTKRELEEPSSCFRNDDFNFSQLVVMLPLVRNARDWIMLNAMKILVRGKLVTVETTVNELRPIVGLIKKAYDDGAFYNSPLKDTVVSLFNSFKESLEEESKDEELLDSVDQKAKLCIKERTALLMKKAKATTRMAQCQKELENLKKEESRVQNKAYIYDRLRFLLKQKKAQRTSPSAVTESEKSLLKCEIEKLQKDLATLEANRG